MTKIFNQSFIKSKRRSLRKKMPSPEILIWNRLRNRQLNNYKFRRQYSIGKFIADFYCPELKLVIEIDGDSHFKNVRTEKYDQHRQSLMQFYGIHTLRFNNNDVCGNLDGVLEKIREIIGLRIEKQNSQDPPPLTPPC